MSDQIGWGKVLLGAGGATIVALAAIAAAALHTRQPSPGNHDAIAPHAVEPEPASAPPPISAAQRRVMQDAVTARNIADGTDESRDGLLCAIDGQQDRTVTFALLERSPQRFEGHRWVFSGRAIQVQDIPDDPGSFALVSLDSYGQNIVAVFTYLRPSDSVVADRRVRVYGRISGTFTYDTRGGQSRTVPRVDAVAVIRDNQAPRCRR